MRIIGIDPGLSGAIAILDGLKIFDMFDMPVMSEGKKNKNQLNSAQLVNIIKGHILSNDDTFVIVEQVSAMPGQGVTSMFNFVKNLFENSIVVGIYCINTGKEMVFILLYICLPQSGLCTVCQFRRGLQLWYWCVF